jgi:hypothetical protein
MPARLNNFKKNIFVLDGWGEVAWKKYIYRGGEPHSLRSAVLKFLK